MAAFSSPSSSHVKARQGFQRQEVNRDNFDNFCQILPFPFFFSKPNKNFSSLPLRFQTRTSPYYQSVLNSQR